MKIGIRKEVEVEAKTLSINMKVRDRFSAKLIDEQGDVIAEQQGDYVPGFMPGEHYGDYLMLDINIETGQIKNWKSPDLEDWKAWINKLNGNSDDD